MAFLKIAEFAAADADADALAQLHDDAVQAIVIKNVFTPQECTTIVADLECNGHGFPTSAFPAPFKSFFYGANLNLADGALTDYFAMAPAFERGLTELLLPHGGFARVTGLLSRLDNGRAYKAPATADGSRRYMATTFRSHCEGGYIPAHFDNDQRGRPAFRDLRPRISGDLLSFVLTLSRADAGGTLEIFDAKADDFGAAFRKRDGGAPKPDLSMFESQRFDVEAGTIVIVQSGRYLHRVTRVEGPRKRWTACSFMARATEADEVYCWG